MAINFNNIQSNTPEKYKYVLDTNNGTFVLKNAPIGWDASFIELNRDMLFGGLFLEGITTNYDIPDPTYVKDGYHALFGRWNGSTKQWTKGLYLENKLFARAELKIYYLDRNTLQYVQFPTSFEHDFNTLKTVKIGKGVNGVQIKVLPTGFVAKLMKRKDIPVDLTRTESLGGYQIVDYVDLKKNINFPEIKINYTSKYENNASSQLDIEPIKGYLVQHTLIESDFTEAQTINALVYNIADGLNNTYCIFKNALENVTFIVNSTMGFRAENTGVQLSNKPGREDFNLDGDLKIGIIDADGFTLVEERLITTLNFNNAARLASATITDESVTLTTGQSMVIYIENFKSAPSPLAKWIQTISTSTTIVRPVINTAPKTIESFPVYEALERCLQLILDVQYPLKSDFFGRTDVIKNAAGHLYATESQLSFCNVMNGLCLRGLVLSDTNNSVAVTFEDLFKSLSVGHNLGLGFETIDGEPRIVIEPLAYFYTDLVSLDLSTRVSEPDITREVLMSAAFSQVECGFKDFEYEQVNGRCEYNTKNVRTSQIPTKSKLDLVAEYRFDTKGITIQLENNITGTSANGTTDTKGDKDIFILKTQRSPGGPGGALLDSWKPELEENIQVLNNSSLFQDSSFNLYFTPTWCLLRNKVKVATGLDKVKNSSLRFQVSDKLANLETTDGTTIIIENQDILVEKKIATDPEIGAPLWNAETLEVTIPFYEEDFATVKAYPNKLIKLTDNSSGWIMNLKYSLSKSEATIKLLEKYVSI